MNTDTTILSELKKLNFLVGQWTGAGWVQFGNQRFEFEQNETVYYKLDGAILILEGQGRTKGQVVHNAYGIYSFDTHSKSLKFDTFEASGRRSQASANLEGNTLVWYFRDEDKKVSIRFTARFEGKTWVEEGERSTDENTWSKFFEMTIRKTD